MNDLRTAAQQALDALRELLPDERDPNCGGYDARDVRQWRATARALRAALAQQAEPVEPVAWVASKDGRVIYDNAFAHDVMLRVAGDFEDDEQRARYAQRIVDKLNATPPQRLPLTEEEIVDAVREADLDWQAGWTLDEHEPNRFTTLARAVEQAHGIKE